MHQTLNVNSTVELQSKLSTLKKWEQVPAFPICSDGPGVEQETHTPGIYRNIQKIGRGVRLVAGLSVHCHSTPRHRLALVSSRQEGRHTLLCQKNACRRQLAARELKDHLR